MAFRDYVSKNAKRMKKSRVGALVRVSLILSKSKEIPYLSIHVAKDALSLVQKGSQNPEYARFLVDDENMKKIRIIPCEKSDEMARKLTISGRHYLRMLISWSRENSWSKINIKDCESEINYDEGAIEATLPS